MELQEKEFFMREALKEAQKAYDQAEVPIGAVVVLNGEIIGRGHNLREKEQCQEIRKVLVKSDVSFIEDQSVEAILEKLEDAYTRLLPYYEVTRK